MEIAAAEDLLTKVDVVITTAHRSERLKGRMTVARRTGVLEVAVDSRVICRLDEHLRGGSLWTADGNDYYSIGLDFDWGEVVISDGYNH